MKNIQDELLDRWAEQIARDVDKEIIESLLIEDLLRQGWTKAPVTWAQVFLKDMWSIETAVWCGKNATGDYKLLNGNWYFEQAKDATAFVLEWMGI